MKRFVTLALTVLLIAGCQLSTVSSGNANSETDEATYWLNYYPTQCNETPWGDTLAEDAILDYYQTNLGVNIVAIEVNAPVAGFISCAACGCGTGVGVSLQTDVAGKAILLEHGWQEESVTEDWPQDDTDTSLEGTNVNDTPAEDLPLTGVNTNVTINDNTNTEELKVSESELVGVTEPGISPEDLALQTRAEEVQAALKVYYNQHGAYPDDLAVLNLTTDLTGLTYTPIGITPADYYDLSVEYSTGRELMNP